MRVPGGFLWNAKLLRYRAPNGRFVAASTVRRVIDDALKKADRTVRSLSENLRDGKITLAEWQTGMRDAIRTRHVYGAAAGRGGWEQMTQSDWGKVGHTLKGQYEYLNKFARQIEDGTQPLDGRFIRRSEMYIETARKTYEETRKGAATDEGFDEARRILTPGEDHCPECPDLARLGWVPIDEVVQIGDTVCMMYCKCEIEYRKKPD